MGLLITWPLPSFVEEELEKRFKVFRLCEIPSRAEFLKQYSESIRAIAGGTGFGADSELIDSLPNLEIVSTYSMGYDKIDLAKCKERGIRVTNTPDVGSNDVADVAIGLALATLRKISLADGFVRSGLWKNGDFPLSSKVCRIYSSSIFFLLFFRILGEFDLVSSINNMDNLCLFSVQR